MVDFIQPVPDMPQKRVELWQHARIIACTKTCDSEPSTNDQITGRVQLGQGTAYVSLFCASWPTCAV